MRLIIGLMIAGLLTGCGSTSNKTTTSPESIWSGGSHWQNPESAYYDAKTKYLFVSNIAGEGTGKDGNGWITLMDSDGKVLKEKWVTGLNAPKGMRARNGYLWVSDIDQVVSIKISTGQILRRYSIEGAKFLNDITIDTRGTVYVSDTIGSAIYSRPLGGKKFSTFMSGSDLNSPNGLYYRKGKLYVAAWGLTTDWSTETPGKLYEISLKDKSMRNITREPLGNLDGLEIDDNGQFLVSDWVAGKVYRVSPEGESVKLYDFPKGSADIAYIPGKNLIVVPEMKVSKLTTVKN